MSKYLKDTFCQTPSFLAQELYNSNQNINDEIVKHINDLLIELKKDINIKKFPENENPNKIFDIFKKILDFNKQQKGNGLPRMFPRQDKVSNRSRASDLSILKY